MSIQNRLYEDVNVGNGKTENFYSEPYNKDPIEKEKINEDLPIGNIVGRINKNNQKSTTPYGAKGA